MAMWAYSSRYIYIYILLGSDDHDKCVLAFTGFDAVVWEICVISSSQNIAWSGSYTIYAHGHGHEIPMDSQWPPAAKNSMIRPS